MKLNQPLRFADFDWRRALRLLMWGSLAISVLFSMQRVFGIAGQFVMVILDAALGSRWTPHAPWIPWAIAGAVFGVGPALWTIPYVRRRKMLVLWVPLGVMLTIGLIGCLPGVGVH